MQKDPKLINNVLDALIKDPDLMNYAAKVVNDNDKTARERFITLTK